MTSNTERRRFHRFVMNRPASMVIDGVHHPGRLVDISMRGALVRCDQGKTPGPQASGIVDIALDEDAEYMIRMQVSVRHLKEDLVGLQVESLSLEDASLLRRLVELNIGDSELLRRELGEMAREQASQDVPA